MSSFKDYIGAKDLRLWDGIARTFSRLTSTGGSLTQNKIGSVVDILEVYGSGNVYTDATLSTAIASIGSRAVTILFQPGTWTITLDVTIPSNISILCPQGAVLSVSTGKTLTISGTIIAGSYAIFDGAGSIGGSPILDFKNAYWFSATVTDSTTPTYKAQAGGAITAVSVATDTINEKTAAAGVTIDGVKLKDFEVTTNVINERTAAAGVTIDGVLLKDSAVRGTTLESTQATGTAPFIVASTTEVANLRAATSTTATTATSLSFGTEYSGNNTAQSLTSATWISVMTLDIGSVTIGDRIFVAANVLHTSGNAAGVNGLRIAKSSGTGDFTCYHNTASANGIGNTFYQGASVANSYISVDGIIKASSSGTLVLKVEVVTTGTGGTCTPQLYVAKLKAT